MIKELTEAIEKIRRLPAEQQVRAAGLLEALAEGHAPDVLLSAEERALVEEGLADADAGRVVPDEEMAEFWKRLTSS